MRTLLDPGGFPPKSMMLPLGVTTVAALLRGSFRAAPGNHVRGAARKLAPTNNGVTPIRHRDRNSSFIFIVVGPANLDQNMPACVGVKCRAVPAWGQRAEDGAQQELRPTGRARIENRIREGERPRQSP